MELRVWITWTVSITHGSLLSPLRPEPLSEGRGQIVEILRGQAMVIVSIRQMM